MHVNVTCFYRLRELNSACVLHIASVHVCTGHTLICPWRTHNILCVELCMHACGVCVCVCTCVRVVSCVYVCVCTHVCMYEGLTCIRTSAICMYATCMSACVVCLSTFMHARLHASVWFMPAISVYVCSVCVYTEGTDAFFVLSYVPDKYTYTGDEVHIHR
jgi:hypothetical protein